MTDSSPPAAASPRHQPPPNAGDLPPILHHLPATPTDDALFDGFTQWTIEQGIEMYGAQEEGLLELVAGNNVILNTPTGSGKSLVAAAAHFIGLGRDQRSVYTAPIKALVSEKFFELCGQFGSDLVGMITGDGSINPDAPIICCTAEILANWALRDGDRTDVDIVIADEFHFYADPQRGWAWQVPLLELPHCQFLLMSATLGHTRFFEDELTQRTGRDTALVRSTHRPVPLHFEYRTSTLHQSIEALLASGRAPIYLVHFTQRDATEAAQNYLSLDPLSKDDKARVKEIIGNFRFDSPFGKGLKRVLLGGVGVHHAGLLPKYRLLVERLAQAGLLKIICGTDTLGVGVNVPIRSVLFTQLFKYDGNSTRILRVREFQQIAGRAGRRGFDDRGDVWAQAPDHVVANLALADKAADDPKKKKKLVKKKAPDRGYAHWDEGTFTKLIDGDPEALTSSFGVNHQMVMSLLDRPGDGCAAVRRLLTDNHEPRKQQRAHIRRAIAIYRSLVDAGLLEFPDEPDELGRVVRVDFDLQDEFALHQPLSLWALDAIEHLDRKFAVEPQAARTEPGRSERQSVHQTVHQTVHQISSSGRITADGHGNERDAQRDGAPLSNNPFAALADMVFDDDVDDDVEIDDDDDVEIDDDDDVDVGDGDRDGGIDQSDDQFDGVVPDDAPGGGGDELDAVLPVGPDGHDHDDADADHVVDVDHDVESEMVGAEASGSRQRAVAILTIIEAVQESPGVVIAAQLRKAKDDVMAEMKAARVEYEERMERLAKVEPPRPMKDWMYADFNEFRMRHPWVGGNTVKPKSIARDLFERSMTFGEYVGFYGLKQSEGVLLRYLSDVYKGMIQNVPAQLGDDALTDELDEIIHWLGTLVRQVDSSLLDEWERLREPDPATSTAPAPATSAVRPPSALTAGAGAQSDETAPSLTSDPRALRTLVRNAAFGWVEQLSRHQRPADIDADVDIDELLAPYWDEYDHIDIGGDARNASRFDFNPTSGAVVQTIHDPEGHDEWRVIGQVDLDATRAEDRLVARITDIVRL